jgi:hypothetical protein
MTRARLPDRRESETLGFVYAGHEFTLGLSRFAWRRSRVTRQKEPLRARRA